MNDDVLDNLGPRELSNAIKVEFYEDTLDIRGGMDFTDNNALEILVNDATARSICVSIKIAPATKVRSKGFYVWYSNELNTDLACTFHSIMAVAVCSTILKAVRSLKSQKSL